MTDVTDIEQPVSSTTLDAWRIESDVQREETSLSDGWEMVIGLEVHAELATETKMFSPARNHFGGEPNSNVHPVCLGLPGTLPVVNGKAVELSIRLGLALNCTVQRCVFARKNYFYPDMPKDYQISQYDRPLNISGWIDLPSGYRVRVERAHMEEDTGKSTHVGESGRIHDAGYSLVDYNRAGVPLLEIVSHPDVRGPEEAKAYVAELQQILIATEVSDGKFEEGSMRVDANISVRPAGSDELRTRCEVKNVNSLRSLGRAISYEAQRHVDLYESGERPMQETRHWDEEGGRTRAGRSKEQAEDYRYFADPDLVPVDPSPEWIEEIRASLPVLPRERRATLIGHGAVPENAAIVVEKGLDGLVVGAVEAGADAAKAVNHAINNLSRDDQLDAAAFGALVKLETGGDLTSTQAKAVLAEMVSGGVDGTTKSPAEIAADMGFEAMDTSELEGLIDQLIADSPEQWERFVNGDDKDRGKMQGFFTGQIMKATKGQADGKVVNQILSSRRG